MMILLMLLKAADVVVQFPQYMGCGRWYLRHERSLDLGRLPGLPTGPPKDTET